MRGGGHCVSDDALKALASILSPEKKEGKKGERERQKEGVGEGGREGVGEGEKELVNSIPNPVSPQGLHWLSWAHFSILLSTLFLHSS